MTGLCRNCDAPFKEEDVEFIRTNGTQHAVFRIHCANCQMTYLCDERGDVGREVAWSM